MRILIVSDIHANRVALEAIQERFDICLCLGDLVEYGPSPGACIAWVRQHATATVRGNHDHGVIQRVDVQATSGFKYLTQATRAITFQQLSTSDRQFLAELPTSVMMSIAGKRFLLVHASPRDPMDEYVPTTEEAWATRLAGLRVDYCLVGHTHQQFCLSVDRTTVINPGSVGLQRDGTVDARYAMIVDGAVELRHVPYDIEQAIRDFEAFPIDDRARRMIEDVYRHGRLRSPTDYPLSMSQQDTPGSKNGTGLPSIRKISDLAVSSAAPALTSQPR
jgi:putative phosphoesterase